MENTIRNKNKKCPIDAHCHRHCRRDTRIAYKELPLSTASVVGSKHAKNVDSPTFDSEFSYLTLARSFSAL